MLRLLESSNATGAVASGLLRICLILVVAACGAVVVQNVTGMLKDIVHHPVIVQAANWPTR